MTQQELPTIIDSLPAASDTDQDLHGGLPTPEKVHNASCTIHLEARRIRPKKRYFMRGAGLLLLIGAVIFILTVYFAEQARHGMIDVDPAFIVLAGFFLFVVFTAIIAPTLICFDTSWVTPRHRDMQPSEPPDDLYTRVILHEGSKSEVLIYGKENVSVREALLDDWPFAQNLKKGAWYVVDASGNDVTDSALSRFEGIARIFFEET